MCIAQKSASQTFAIPQPQPMAQPLVTAPVVPTLSTPVANKAYGTTGRNSMKIDRLGNGSGLNIPS